jgi:hypothetical protein
MRVALGWDAYTVYFYEHFGMSLECSKGFIVLDVATYANCIEKTGTSCYLAIELVRNYQINRKISPTFSQITKSYKNLLEQYIL